MIESQQLYNNLLILIYYKSRLINCIYLVTDAAAVKEKYLTTGCSKLDVKLKGGIPCRGITQIYGAAGTGKTQLALQLCLTVQLPVTTGGFGAGNNQNI